MGMRVTVNGREVTNPAARALATMIMMMVIAFVMALLVFVALPLLGIAVGVAAGLLAVGAGSLLIGLPFAKRRGLFGGGHERPLRGDRDPDLEGRTPIDLGGRISDRSSDRDE